MIIGNDHAKVVENIREAASQRDFYRKTEVNDPVLTREERSALLNRYIHQRHTFGLLLCNSCCRLIVWCYTKHENVHTRIDGLEYLYGIKGGAIITSNHFSPVDNTVVRHAVNRAFHERLYIVSQDTNLAMTGFVGFLMKYSDIIPISPSMRYTSDYFAPTIKDMLEQGNKILIYPEQEMWLNYRKPRPPKRGAYYYAAVNSVPILSMFVEIKTLRRKESDEFYKISYVMHILPPIYPDPNKNVRENSHEMMRKDYEQKVAAYEKAYGKKLTYDYELGDVAGWIADEDGRD